MDQRLENLRCDERDVLDKSGPKIARHKPISDLLTPTELKPYIPYRSSEDLVYKGTRKCCEFSDKGHLKNTYSSTVSLLRPFSESETGDLNPSTFSLLLKRMKNDGLKWDGSFNICSVLPQLQKPVWLFWLNDVLNSFSDY